MGAQQVLRTAAALGLIAATVSAAPSGPRASGQVAQKERAAVIDLGPEDPIVVRALQAALVKAELEPLDDATEAALTGHATESDALALATAMALAQTNFGALDCRGTIAATTTALPLLAARQAAGLAVAELPRAWAYVLLCADRTGDSDIAMRAAQRLRASGGSSDVAPALLAKYPEVDAVPNVDPIEVDVTTEVPGSVVWLDFAPVGKAPLHLTLSPGEHIIAAASGKRRGFLVGRPIKKQPKLVIEMADQEGPLVVIADMIASWHGKVPAGSAVGEVLDKLGVRAALIRHGDVVEVWGHAGHAEPARLLGGDDGSRTLADADRAAALLADRIESWNAHAPDPDQPLLTEDRTAVHTNHDKAATAWWVYATIGAALVASAIVVYAHESQANTQEILLHYP
ncbi:hypothetical protein BH11MYX1_BH11MYX1_16770 [soil metagenome]